jgi:uncharacterized membrane protein HdeD (DUF308 family)
LDKIIYNMEITSLDRSLRYWWVILIRGVLFILLGIYMLLEPASGYAALGFLFGLFILLAGIAELLRVVGDHTRNGRAWHLFLGVIDIIVGIVFVTHIIASADVLRVIVGLYFLFRGISLLSYSHFRGRSWPLILGGAITAIFGVLIIFNAVFGAITLIIFTAIAFIIMGIFNTWLGLHIRPRT